MFETILDTVGRTPLVSLSRLLRRTSGEGRREGGIHQPRRERQRPRCALDDRRGRTEGPAPRRRHHHRSHRRQHRRRPGDGRGGEGLPLHLRAAGQDEQREDFALARRTVRKWSSRRPAVAPDSPESYNGVADQLAREIPGAWRPNQFTNDANPEIHYRTTGPEIWEQTRGKVTVVRRRASAPAARSAACGRYLKEMNPNVEGASARTRKARCFSGGTPKPWKVEGIGEDFVPKTFTSKYVDEWVRVGDRGIVSRRARTGPPRRNAARRQHRHERRRALRYARRLGPGQLVVAARVRHRTQLSEQVLRRRAGLRRTS